MSNKKATKRKVVTIKRSRWASAKRVDAWNKKHESDEKYAEACLYDTNSKMMCCLGFVCRAEGLKVAEIRDIGLPSDVDAKQPLPNWLTGVQTQAACINDDASLTETVRERKLKKLFRELTPVDLEFVP